MIPQYTCLYIIFVLVNTGYDYVIVLVQIRRRVKLEGAELDEYLRKRKDKEQEEQRIKIEQKR